MENQIVKMNSEKLKALTNTSHTAVVTMLMLALRERARGYSNITLAKQQLVSMGEKVVDEDFQKFWKDLQDLGIGTIVYGRRGGPDKFQWYYSLKSIAKVAIEGKENEVRELAKRVPKVVAIKPIQPVIKKRRSRKVVLKIERKLYSITLSSGLIAEVILPSNATEMDLDKIRATLGQRSF